MRLLLKLLVAANAAMALAMAAAWQDKPEDSNHSGTRVAFLYYEANGVPIYPEALEGARDAAHTLGCTFQPVPLARNPQALLEQIKRTGEQDYDALCVPAMSGIPGLDAFIEEVIDRGIVLTTYDERPDCVAGPLRWRGLGFTGEDPYKAGWDTAVELVRRAAMPRGTTVLLIHGKETNESSRVAGASAALKELGMEAQRIARWRGTDQEFRDTLRNTLLKSAEPIGGLLCLAGDLVEVARICENSYSVPLPLAGYQRTPETLALLQRRTDCFLYDMQWQAQGYLSVVQACLSAATGCSGLDTPLTSRFIDRETPWSIRNDLREALAQ